MKLLLNPEGLDPEMKNISSGVNLRTETVTVTTNLRMTSLRREHEETNPGKKNSQGSYNYSRRCMGIRTSLLLILFVLFGPGHKFSMNIFWYWFN